MVTHAESRAPRQPHVERERLAPSYMTRVLRLALLAADIVDAILDWTQGPELTLALALEAFSKGG